MRLIGARGLRSGDAPGGPSRLGRPRAGLTQEGLLAIPRSSAPRLRRPKRHENDEGLESGKGG
jgi:hypothetical protein